MSGPDLIALRGVRAFGRHGVLPEERRDGQTFVVDVEMVTDVSLAARTDALDATVDYAAVARSVVSVVEGQAVDLIETLAERIADLLLADERIDEVRVTVHKPEAPVGVPFADVSVTVVRRRG